MIVPPCDVCGQGRPLVAYHFKTKLFFCQACLDGRIRRKLVELVAKARTEAETRAIEAAGLRLDVEGVSIEVLAGGVLLVKVPERLAALSATLRSSIGTSSRLRVLVGGNVIEGRVVQLSRDRAKATIVYRFERSIGPAA